MTNDALTTHFNYEVANVSARFHFYIARSPHSFKISCIKVHNSNRNFVKKLHFVVSIGVDVEFSIESCMIALIGTISLGSISSFLILPSRAKITPSRSAFASASVGFKVKNCYISRACNRNSIPSPGEIVKRELKSKFVNIFT